MDFLWHLVISTGLWIPNVLGFNLIFGKGKILHFGPVGVSIVAAYATFLTLHATGSYALAIATGGAAALLISALFAWLSFHLEPDGFGIMSIAVHLALLAVVLNWTDLTRGALGLPRIPRLPGLESLPAFALLTTTIASLWIAFILWCDRSTFGRQLAALAEHPWHATALGVSRQRTHLLAFLLGGIGATLTNILYPSYIRLLHPNDYAFPFLIFFVTAVVAGRPGSVPGVILSTILLVLLKEGLRFAPLPIGILGPLRLLLFGVILLGAVWIRRKELFPLQRTI